MSDDEEKVCDDCAEERESVSYDLDGRKLCYNCYEVRRVNGEYDYD